MFAQMSFLTRVCIMVLCCLALNYASNYASGILFKYVSLSDNDKEWSYSTSQSTDDSRLLFTVILVCFGNLIYSIYTSIYSTETCVVSSLKYAFHFCRSKIGRKGKDIEWIQKSSVHRGKLEKLVETLKYKPNAVQTIGGYNVCFEESFVIGEGSDGTKVFVGLGTDGVEVAIKRLNSEFKILGKVEKDIMNSQKLKDNPYVLRYQFYTEMDKYAYLITDLQDETLKQFVGKSNLAELQNEGPTILRQILLGIDALHGENILHRDLKPENVLVNFEGKMVLGDFGICRRLPLDQTTLCGSKVIVPKCWMAVESLPNENDDDLLPDSEIRVRYNKKSDVQVLGMLFYFVLTKGKHPFGKHVFRVGNIIEGKYDLNDLMDADAKDLIEWMLQHNKLERPTVKQCLKHPYLMSPEEKFKFLTAVGNEPEIRTREEITDVSVVVQELNAEASRTIPAWCENIDGEVYSYFSRDRVYSANVTGLLQFICDVQQQVKEEIPPPSVQLKFGTSRAYFLQVFPTLSMIVYGVLRKYPTWRDRDSLKEFF